MHIVRIRRFNNGLLGKPADARAIERAALNDYPDNIVYRLISHQTDDNGVIRIKVL